MHCLGVSNHSPVSVASFLAKHGVVQASKEVHFVPVGMRFKTLRKLKAYPVLMFLNFDDFYGNLKVLNQELVDKDVLVFVFGSPIRLCELDGCVPFDFEVGPESAASFRFIKPSVPALRRAVNTDAKVVRKSSEYLTTLITTVCAGSLLSPLMTFIYTLSSAEQQHPAKLYIFKYLIEGLKDDVLDKQMRLIVSENKLAKMWEILHSPAGKSVRAVLQQLRKEPGANIASVCKKAGVQQFEITYLRAAYRKAHPEKRSKKSAAPATAKAKPSTKKPSTVREQKRSASAAKKKANAGKGRSSKVA